MKKWFVAIGVLLLISCSGHGSGGTAPENSGEDFFDSPSSSATESSKSSSSENDSQNSSSSNKENGSCSSSIAYESTSKDTSSYLHEELTAHEFSWIIEDLESVIDFKKMTMTDKRDGRVYQIVLQDSVVFMAQNLAYETYDSWCYNDYELNCERYGRLYTHESAIYPHDDFYIEAPKGACPMEWTMTTAGPVYGYAGRMTTDGYFTKLTREGWYWSSGSWEYGYMLNHPDKYYASHVCAEGVTACNSGEFDQRNAHSVSCRYRWRIHVPDSVTLPKVDYKTYKTPEDLPTYAGPYGEIVDLRDGNIYKTVEIGNQTWMAENLRYKIDSSRTYEGMPEVGQMYHWAHANGFYNGSTKAKSTWPIQGVCPKGWHIPTKTDWLELFDYVLQKTDGVFIARPLRSVDGWETEEPAGTNSFGFNLKPSGGAYISGDYYWKLSLAGDGIYMVSDDRLPESGWYMVFPNAKSDQEPRLKQLTREYYFSFVRCVKGEGFRTIVDPAEDEPPKDTTSVDTTGTEPPADSTAGD